MTSGQRVTGARRWNRNNRCPICGGYDSAATNGERYQFAFNVLNGTLDLRTGQLRPHRQSDMITKLAPVVYDPDAQAPRWEKFLARVRGRHGSDGRDDQARAWSRKRNLVS